MENHLLLLCTVVAGVSAGWNPGIDAGRLALKAELFRHDKHQVRPPLPEPTFTMYNFTQQMDHVDFVHNGTFNQRYMVSMDFWDKKANAPIFFFTGAEGGDITELYNYAYSYTSVVAKSMNAMIVYMEHRYFGHSQPFGPTDSYTPTANRIGLLSVEQSMADYATIITSVLDEHDAWQSPVITFGASLAGTLAGFMRSKYPSLVDMAWASSTPMQGYPGLAKSQFSWRGQITTNHADIGGADCPALARRGFVGIQGRDPKDMASLFNTCEDPYAGIADDLQGIAWSVLEAGGEFCYPASQSPIAGNCAAMRSAGKDRPKKSDGDAAIFAALVKAGGQRWYTGKCLNITAYKAADETPDAQGWSYLACTEIVHPIGANNVTDMFPPDNWTIASNDYWCKIKYNISSRPAHIPTQFGLWHQDRFARAHTRILYAYGLRDPWHTLGWPVGNDLAPELPIITIADGSHCADMVRPDSKHDTQTMLDARAKITAQLKKWVTEVTAEKQKQLHHEF